MSVSRILLILLIWLPLSAAAQGFAGLGTFAEGFESPTLGTALEFPADHGAHPDFRIEWWYITANLVDEDGEDYGIQWTVFRSALKPTSTDDWSSPQLWMGHAGLTTRNAHYVAERRARGGIGQAGATADPFEVWIDEWRLAGDFDAPNLFAQGRDFSYDLQLTAMGPIVKHGNDGYSVKSAQGQASYYYSQPFYGVEGMIKLPTGERRVSGQAWLDREWSSQPLGQGQSGWDWFSLSFKDGAKLMGFRLRGEADFTSGTYITPDGDTTQLANGDLQVAPIELTLTEGGELPTTWSVSVPSQNVEVLVTALNPQAWMATSIPYWEGPVTVTGNRSGVGYLEMTGYDQ